MITVLRPRLATTLVGFSAVLVAACGATGGGGTSPQPIRSPDVSASAAPAPTATATPTPVPSAAPTSGQLPAILVESPASGASVRSPLHATGSANTFEATFRLRLVDAHGRVLFDVQVHATSGTGTRGTFDTTVPFTGSGPATLMAYEVSMRDGSMTNVSRTPIQLVQ